jgi:hypothetical protein
VPVVAQVTDCVVEHEQCHQWRVQGGGVLVLWKARVPLSAAAFLHAAWQAPSRAEVGIACLYGEITWLQNSCVVKHVQAVQQLRSMSNQPQAQAWLTSARKHNAHP